jgi:hypothetical protein
MAIYKKIAAETILETIRPDMLHAFSSIPAYGSIGLTAHFVGGELNRIDWSGSVQRKSKAEGVVKA